MNNFCQLLTGLLATINHHYHCHTAIIIFLVSDVVLDKTIAHYNQLLLLLFCHHKPSLLSITIAVNYRRQQSPASLTAPVYEPFSAILSSPIGSHH